MFLQDPLNRDQTQSGNVGQDDASKGDKPQDETHDDDLKKDLDIDCVKFMQCFDRIDFSTCQ
jgi:hypothetical protein